MSVDEKLRSRRSRGRFRRLTQGLLDALWPREGLSLTREGLVYVAGQRPASCSRASASRLT